LQKLGFEDAPSKEGKLYVQRSKANGLLICAENLRTGNLDLIALFGKAGKVSSAVPAIWRAIEEKTQKLSSHYVSKAINALAVLVPEQISYMFIEDCVVQEVIDECKSEWEKFVGGTTGFDEVYIIYLDNVLMCEMKSGEMKVSC